MNKMTNSPSIIAIYDTREGGEVIVRKTINELLVQPKEPPFITTKIVTGEQIRNGFLDLPNVVGLFMPGRNRGQHYCDELNIKGFKAIHNATQNGLSVMTVCAASYVMSKRTIWHTKFGQAYSVRCTNKYGLFNGVSEGAIHELWDDNSYFENIPEGQSYSHLLHREGCLPASIVDVSFENKNMSIVYGGGGRFHPQKPEEITVLASHQQTMDKTPAIIEVMSGNGAVILSNVHPEVPRRQVEAIFRTSNKAKENPRAFEQALSALDNGQEKRDQVFNRFINNCTQSCKAEAYTGVKTQNYGLASGISFG